MERLAIVKTYKMYIGGAFVRSESGQYYVPHTTNGEQLANVCLCSKKDVRNAVVVARKAQSSWASRSAYNRSQIIYRIAEMLETRKAQFVDELMRQGISPQAAQKEVVQSIDRIVYYAGWCDKIAQVTGSVNPVASSHFNFSVYQPVGVVGIIADQTTALIGLISQLIPIIASGNTAVILASEALPLCAVTFAEVVHSSDVPSGVVNILTGNPIEPATVLSTHMDVNALLIGTPHDASQQWKKNTASNLKRMHQHEKDWRLESQQGLHYITDFMELKTTWHPIENIGGGSSSY